MIQVVIKQLEYDTGNDRNRGTISDHGHSHKGGNLHVAKESAVDALKIIRFWAFAAK